jgi:hypothetical protein
MRLRVMVMLVAIAAVVLMVSPTVAVADVTTHTIVPTVIGAGTISPDTTQSVGYGSDCDTFTITPDAGHEVVAVLVDYVSQGPISSYKFTNVTADHTIVVIIGLSSYPIVPTAGANGSISPSTTQTVTYGSDSSTFTVTPDSHYQIADVLVDGSSIGTSNSVIFRSVSASHTIAASFTSTYTIVPSASANGTISPNTTQSVAWGSNSATFTVTTTTAGYHIADVLVDGSSIGASSQVIFRSVSANHTIAASFANTYTIVPSAGAHGSISPSSTQVVTGGSDSATFTITPDLHYHIADVLVDGGSIGASSEVIFRSVSATHTIAASFAIDTREIVPTAGAHGSITPNTTQTVNYGSDSTTFSIEPSSTYHIADVLVDGDSIGASSSVVFRSVTASHTIAASFADTFTIVPSASANASISPGTTQTVTYGSASATFTITTSTVGYHIADVLVDGESIGASTSVVFTNVQANHTIAASSAINTYTVVPSAGAHGSISPSSTQIIDYGSDCPTFTIAADPGYHVATVTVDGSSVGASTSVVFTSVTATHTVAAAFAVNSASVFGTAHFVGLSGTSITTNYHQSVTVEATMTETSGTPISGVAVRLQTSSDGVTYADAAAASELASGTYSATVTPEARTYYRLVFAGDSDWAASESSAVLVTPRVSLSTPSSNSSISHTKWLSVTGTLRPAHASSSRTVKLVIKRYRSGAYRSYTSKWTKVSNKGSYSRYSASVKLPRGTYRIYAVAPADSLHAYTTSGYKRVVSR